MEPHQPLKKRIVEQPILHPQQRAFVKTLGSQYVQQQPRQQQFYQYVPISDTRLEQHRFQQHPQPQLQHYPEQYQQHQQHQQQYQDNHQHLQPQQYSPQQHQLQEVERNHQRLLIQPPLSQQVVHYEYIDRPMTLNAWTQTKADEFPSPSPPRHQGNENALLAKIKELEETLKMQAEFINQLKDENLRTPSPPQTVPNSTTITPTAIKHGGTRYRILAQPDEATSEAQIEIELSDEAIHHNCSSDSDRLEICLSDENELSPRTPGKSGIDQNIHSNPGRPDLETATVSIGPNGTKIPVSAYEKMSWSSPSLATRKLLTLIFDRETLATHSMTGKASPAFKDLDKPVKGKLDPAAVEDIIFIVSKKCAVSQKEIRAAITTKCADENKMIKLQALKRIGVQDSKRPALRELNRNKSEDFSEENS